MAVEPLTWNVTVPLHRGGRLGATVCDATNTIRALSEGGALGDLNASETPGSVAVGDRIVEVNGKRGVASAQIRSWVRGLEEGSGTLSLKVLRPVEFDVEIDPLDGEEIGCWMLDCTGFLTRITSKGTIDVHNAKRGPDAPECLRIGDRLVRVTGVEPAAEDGAMGDVMPYLRLALAAGVKPLKLRVRRGEGLPREKGPPHGAAAAWRGSSQLPLGRRVSTTIGPEPCEGAAAEPLDWPWSAARSGFEQSRWFSRKLFAFSCLPNHFSPHAAARSLNCRPKLKRKTPTGKHGSEVYPEVEKGSRTPSTPSTKGDPTPSTSKDPLLERPVFDVEARVHEVLPDGSLLLPGVIARTPPPRCRVSAVAA
jgi:hypothetical protein